MSIPLHLCAVFFLSFSTGHSTISLSLSLMTLHLLLRIQVSCGCMCMYPVFFSLLLPSQVKIIPNQSPINHQFLSLGLKTLSVVCSRDQSLSKCHMSVDLSVSPSPTMSVDLSVSPSVVISCSLLLCHYCNLHDLCYGSRYHLL